MKNEKVKNIGINEKVTWFNFSKNK